MTTTYTTRSPRISYEAKIDRLQSAFDAMQKQRNELLAALRKAVSWDKNRPAVARGSLHEAFYMEVPEWVHEARAALAKAEGK